MSSVAGTRAVASPRLARRPRLGGAALGRGLVTAYLSLIVLIPIAALVAKSTGGGLDAFWTSLTSPLAVSALKLILVVSVIVVAAGVWIRIVSSGTT